MGHSRSNTWSACTLLLGLVTAPLGASAQGYAANSCWGNCGWFAQTASGELGCACGPDCEQMGDCCADKHTYCANTATSPVCPLVGVGGKNAAGQQVTSGVYPDVYGTDLGFTFQHGNTLNILFGDTWVTSIWGDRSKECQIPPLQDDLQASFVSATRPAFIPADPRSTQPFESNTCQPLLNIDRLPPLTTGFLPIGVLPYPNGPALESGWLRTPISGFSDGSGAWGVFELLQFVSCSAIVPCPTGFSCDAADGRCVDASVANYGVSNAGMRDWAMYLEIARQSSARTNYVRGTQFLTTKFKNSVVQTVVAFDPATATYDYTESSGTFTPGKGALLMWGRPEFATGTSGGELPVFLLYQRLPLTVSGNTITNWSPQFFAGVVSGAPTWSASQAAAKPLDLQTASPTYADFSVPMQMDVAWIPALRKWVMLYGGDVADWQDGGVANEQPRTGSIHMRMADQPWGPWSPPVPVLDRYRVAPLMACDAPEPAGFDWDRAPNDGVADSFATPGSWVHAFEPLADAVWKAGCSAGDPVRPSNTLPLPPSCKKSVPGVSLERGNLYAPNIISQWTTSSLPANAYTRRATLFWNVSTWNPYQVALVSTLIELPSPQLVFDTHKYQLRAAGSSLMVRAAAGAPVVDGRKPVDPEVQFTLRKASGSGGDVPANAKVYVETPRGFLTRVTNTSLGYSVTKVAAAEWELRRENTKGMLVGERFSLRQSVSGTFRYLAVSGSALTTTTTNGASAKLLLTWQCQPTDTCGLTQP